MAKKKKKKNPGTVRPVQDMPASAAQTDEAAEELSAEETADVIEETAAAEENTETVEEAATKETEEAAEEAAAEETEEAVEEAAAEEAAENVEETAAAEETAEVIEEIAAAEETAESVEEVAAEEAAETIEETAAEPAEEPKKKKKGLWIALAVIAALAAGVLGLWPRFHDLTVELGVETISITEFMTWIADPARAAFVTDPSDIDIAEVGSTEVVLRTGHREQTVTLNVVDTTAPEAVFKEIFEAPPTYKPVPDDFIEEIVDMDETTVAFAGEPEFPESYGDCDVSLVVTDASGNETRGSSHFSVVWMKRELAVEYGTKITKQDLLTDPAAGEELISQEDIDRINESDLGVYEIVSSYQDKTVTCKVTVQDTTPPALELRNVVIYLTQKAKLKDFVIEAADAYGDVDLKLDTALDFGSIGTQHVQITATDLNGNSVTKDAKLTIKADDVGPDFYGLSYLFVRKHGSAPDLSYGVKAVDNVDGQVSFTFSDANVDYDKAGVYYIVYTAYDSKGNKGTAKRTIEVSHDKEDERQLCDSFYSKISDRSPTGLALYVRNHISYSSSWGDGEPVWYGLRNKRGNCYVHASILAEMLTRAGYPNHLIWSTDKGHYWNQVYYNGTWWHVDSTPSSTYPTHLMTDDDRLAHLPGRNWDRDLFPECPGN